MALVMSQNGVIIRGTPNNGVYTGPDAPDSSLGKNGDFYIQYIKSFYSNDDLGTIIPVQTNNDNCISDNQGFDGGYAYKMFDGVESGNSYWSSYLNPTFPVYAGYDFGENNKKKINAISIKPRVWNLYQQLRDFEIIASDDLNTWHVLMSDSIPNQSTVKWHSYIFNNDSFYRYYALKALNTNGSTATIYEMHMSDEYEDQVINYLTVLNRFIKENNVWKSLS